MLGNVDYQITIPKISREIFRIAVNNFEPDNFYLRIGSNLENIISGLKLQTLPINLKTQLFPFTLPFITLFQYLEELTDRTALESIQYRIEWKFALHLSMEPPAMRKTILCEYRRYVLENDKRLEDYQNLIDRVIDFLPQYQSQRIFADQMLHDVCEFNQKYAAVSVLSNALTILKLNHPKWLENHNIPRLFARYLPETSQFDVLIPHAVSQFQLDDVLRDIDFLTKEIEISNSIEIKTLHEIVTLSKIVYQIRMINTGRQTVSDCKDFAAILHKQEAYKM